MPKKNKANRSWGSDGGNREVGKYYFEHDDRVAEPPRRVSFKPSGRSKRRNKSWELLRSVMDDDVDMSGAGTSAAARAYDRFNPYSGRAGRQHGGGGRGRRSGRNSPSINASGHRRRTLITNQYSWYKVVLPHGGKYSKDYILKTLANYIAPRVLTPLAYKISGNESYFYVEDQEVAEDLLNADRQITLTDGFKLNIIVRASMPNIVLTENLKAILREVMAKRYNPITKALDLSKLRDEPALADQVIPFQRTSVFSAVTELVSENITDLVALDLSDNKLGGYDILGVLSRRLPSVTVLHMGQNKIRNIGELDGLKGLRLVELVLEGNPVCRHYQDKSVYVRYDVGDAVGVSKKNIDFLTFMHTRWLMANTCRGTSVES